MTSRQLAQVGLGLIGVWALLDALSIFAGVASVGGPLGRDAVVLAIPLALLLGLSYVLVFRSEQFASAIAPDAHDATEHATHDLSRTLVVLLGVWLLVQTLPSIVNHLLLFLTVAAGDYRDPSGPASILRSVIGSAIQLVIALYLIMRPERLLAFVQRKPPEPA